MSDSLQYILGTARFANAEMLTNNIKVELQSTWRTIPDSNVVEMVSLAKRYDKERQASTTHRIYGCLSFITTNELETSTTFLPSTLILNTTNYNLQLLYPSSHTSNLTLSDFSCDVFALLCTYYSGGANCQSHKIYHGLPFTQSNPVTYRNRTLTSLKTYAHKYGNNIKPDDYVYVIPGVGGVSNKLYGINKVVGNVLEDGTFNVLVLDNTELGTYGGSYKKIIEPSKEDIGFLLTIGCELYITGATTNDLFIRCEEPHNVTIGDYVDVRYSAGTNFNVYNGIHKVSRIVNQNIYVCDVPSHILHNSMAPVQDINSMNPTAYGYQYRYLDGHPSEYYVRKFKVLDAGDYQTTQYGVDFYLQELHMSNTIWKNVPEYQNNGCNVIIQSGSDDDKVCSFVFNTDVNISSYADNLGRPLTEIYLGVIKRKNPGAYNTLITNFQGSLVYDGITTFYKPLNLPSYSSQQSKSLIDYFNVSQFNDGGFNVGYEYYGDLVEYSPVDIKETTLDPFQFRAGGNIEGYVYEPFKKIQLRYFSTDIETSNNYYGNVPAYASYYHNVYQWRELSPYGFKDVTNSGVESVDRPFVNGAHYNFIGTSLYLRRQNKDPDSQIILFNGNC